MYIGSIDEKSPFVYTSVFGVWQNLKGVNFIAGKLEVKLKGNTPYFMDVEIRLVIRETNSVYKLRVVVSKLVDNIKG